MKVITPSSTRWLRLSLLLLASFLVVAGIGIQHIGLAATTTTTRPPVTTTTTTTTRVPTSVPVTTTTLYAPGVVVSAPTGPRRASHCPLTLAAPATSKVSVNLLPRDCTVLEIGDSLGNDLGWGLARELTAYRWLHLVQLDKSSSGLANAWFFSWPAHLATDLRQYHPNVVIVMLGGNDQQDYYVHGVDEIVGTAPWRATYRHLVTQIIDEARAAGAQVLWVGLPVMQPAFYSQGAAMLDAQYAAAVAAAHGAAYLPTWHLFSTPAGTFRSAAPVNGVVQALRSSDGIHFSEIGENVLSTYVARQMGSIFHLPLEVAQPATITP